jgi:hypothetical protein
MYLIQILLPLYDNAGKPLSSELFARVRAELTERYGGLTAYSRSPAQGLWKDRGETVHDDIVVFEVMADALDRGWWRHYRQSLEAAFRQDTIMVRAQAVIPL